MSYDNNNSILFIDINYFHKRKMKYNFHKPLLIYTLSQIASKPIIYDYYKALTTN